MVAVGTTVVRTLESAAADGGVRGNVRLHRPLHHARISLPVVDAMITNFHAPGTTLIVMMAAVLGDVWRQVYETALDAGLSLPFVRRRHADHRHVEARPMSDE